MPMTMPTTLIPTLNPPPRQIPRHWRTNNFSALRHDLWSAVTAQKERCCHEQQ